jgi:glutaminyl-peptide cyclotransferase
MKRLILLSLPLVALFAGGCREEAISFDPENALSAQVSGEKAFAHVASLVELGPRPAGSEAIEKSRLYLEKELAALGWVTKRQLFTTDSPKGEFEFTNLRARFGEAAWSGSVSGLLSSHYDTKLYDRFEFVGANDGGSSTGLLIELARVLALNPGAAAKIELVFFDGEEAFGTNITAKDGLYGSKYYAAQWLMEKESQRPKWGVLLDMIGDADLNIRAATMIPRSSLRELASAKEKTGYVVDIESVESELQQIARDLLRAAADLDLRSYIGISSDYIIDDHIPLNVVAGIPTIDLIDFDFPDWHTPGDTLDKISAESLAITGRVTLHLVEKYLLPEGN